MSKPKDYTTAIAHMRKLERAQREMRGAGARGTMGAWNGHTGASVHVPLPTAARAVLQRELTHNARVLTSMHVALAFCRCRFRREHGFVSLPKPLAYAIANWIGILSKGTGWNSLDAVMSQYQAWANWCNGTDASPEYNPVAWQREFLRRERKLRQARKAARKSAQGRVPVSAVTNALEALNAITAAVITAAAESGSSVAVVDESGQITVHSSGEVQP